jgi:hypothetical protein
MPRRGYRTQPKVSTLGIVHQERPALKGAPDRTSQKGGNGSDGSTSQLRTLTLAWQIGASFIWYPHFSSLQGEPFI